MSQLSDHFKNHVIWQHLQNLGPVIDNALNREGTDVEALDALARLKSIQSFVSRRLAGGDSYLFQSSSIDSLAGSIQNITTEVQNFVANGNTGHITNANSHGDAVLTQLAQINVPLTSEDFLAAKEAAEAYRGGIEKALSGVAGKASNLSGQIDSLQTRATELANELTNERNKLSTIATDFQAQFSTAQESRSSTYANDQQERQNRFNEFQNQFNTSQDTRNSAFTTNQQEQQDRFNNLITEFMQKLTAQNDEFTKQRESIAESHKNELAEMKQNFVDVSTKLHEEIIQHKIDVEKLVGVIGNLGVTSGYLTTANGAKKTVMIWQAITVASMMALIIMAYLTFLPNIQAGFTWGGFAGRVFVTLTIGALAAYAGTQADKYQKVERYNRRLALELEAIGPFIAPLSEEKQADFRVMIGDRSFGQGDGQHKELDAKSPTSVADLVTDPKWLSFITGIIKAGK